MSRVVARRRTPRTQGVKAAALLGPLLGLLLVGCAHPSAGGPPCGAAVDVSSWDVADAEVVPAAIRLPPGHGPAMRQEDSWSRSTAWSIGGLVVVVGVPLPPHDPAESEYREASDSATVCTMDVAGFAGFVQAYSGGDVTGPLELLEGMWKLPGRTLLVQITAPLGSSRDTMQAIMNSLTWTGQVR